MPPTHGFLLGRHNIMAMSDLSHPFISYACPSFSPIHSLPLPALLFTFLSITLTWTCFLLFLSSFLILPVAVFFHPHFLGYLKMFSCYYKRVILIQSFPILSFFIGYLKEFTCSIKIVILVQCCQVVVCSIIQKGSEMSEWTLFILLWHLPFWNVSVSGCVQLCTPVCLHAI